MATPEIEQATAFTAVIGTEPVAVVLPRFLSVPMAESGALVTADAWIAALTEHGAQLMRDTDFLGDPAPGWTVAIGPAVTTVRINGPAGLGEIYEGELQAETKWRERVAGLHHIDAGVVVIISGRADQLSPDAALDMLESGRAVWVRAHTTLS
ncbi:hypothetical protein [Nocardia noduli]|uniref:hypothetical protein n=1 Tax=Nocardia noduli TaxID=2815722 RepID=UPI001C23CDB9|nr:hypothetical protein [Nocardia noduli]